MDAEELYEKLLNLASPWHVKAVAAEYGAETVLVYLEHAETATFVCPLCGRSCDVCDHTEEKAWRHLDTCQKQTHVLARLPVVSCPEHGKQPTAPSFADADAPVTSAFTRRLKQLTSDLGSLEKAAIFARVDMNLMRSILSDARKPSTMGKSPAAGSLSERTTAKAPDHSRQLSLFSQSDMILVNQGVQALKTLELEQAIELFRKHQKIYPKGHDVTPKIALAEFLLQGLWEAPSELPEHVPHLCRLWNRFEEHARSHGMSSNDRLVAELQKAFFDRMVQEIEREGVAGTPLIAGEIPFGYILLQAGRHEQAIPHLQAVIPKAPHNAAVYGYLGDAYWLRGDVNTARQCYREGCLIDPAAIDWQHLKDAELKDLSHDLQLLYGFDAELATAWLPSHARIAGLFERKIVRLHDGLKELVDEYVSLQKSLAKRANPATTAKLFFRGIILCENEESLRFIKKVDPIEVRRTMKQANPDLFSDFLANVLASPAKSRAT